MNIFHQYLFNHPENKVFVYHKLTHGIGYISKEMDYYNPPQYGIIWVSGANYSSFKDHYFWNDKTNIRVLGNKSIDELTTEFNSHSREFERLFTLCDKNLILLEILYLIMQTDFRYSIPGTIDELNYILYKRKIK